MKDYHAHFEHENFYHIFNRGNNGENLFLNENNYHFFLSKWIKYIATSTDTFAYCLMPNHFHFLIKIKSQDNFKTKSENLSWNGQFSAQDVNVFLEKQFKKLFSSYALAFNKQQNRHGSLFEKRFKRINVQNDHYLSKMIHYIHNNPIHHGFEQDYMSWKFSSFRSILSENPSILARNEALNWFGGRQSFVAFHETQLDYNTIKDLTADVS